MPFRGIKPYVSYLCEDARGLSVDIRGSMEYESVNFEDVGCGKVKKFEVVRPVLGNESRRRATVIYALRGKLVFGCRLIVTVAS